jgi:hypothetical protein
LNWRSDGVNEFIAESMDQVKIMHDILKTMKDNLAAVQDIVKKWDKPMISRKTKPMENEEFERSFKALKATYHSDIK